MLTSFYSVSPIFCLIIIGYILKNNFIKEEIFWKSVNKLVYYLLFPILLILEISNADFSGTRLNSALFATIGGTLTIAILIFLCQSVGRVENKLFTSIFQGGIRYNSYVFIALSQSFFGNAGIALSGVFIAYMIVLTNIMSVIVLNLYGLEKTTNGKDMALSLLKNPLIGSALGGVLLNRVGYHIDGALEQLMQYLGDAATPFSLMSVGAGLVLIMHPRKLLATVYSVGLKLLLMPACTLILLKLQGTAGISANIALLYASMPCAGNAYILSRQMGGDSEAMASIITWSTLVSVITITIIFGMTARS